jgi:hypothetical protein
VADGFDVREMDDQRIERRAPLGREDRRHRMRVGGIGPKAVNGLGRKRDQPAGAKNAGGAVEIGLGYGCAQLSTTARRSRASPNMSGDLA